MDSTKKSQSHLSEIMKTLNISGKELALSLHIDETLVRKYKNNKRRLSKETAFEISRYIAEYHAKEPSLFFRLTRNILEPYAEKSLEACEKEEIISALNNFLLDFSVSNNFMSTGFTDVSWGTEIKIYTGLQGRLEVQNDFFKNASGSKNEIIIGDFIYFDYENEKYFDIYSRTNKTYMDLINAGHKIILIITIDEKYQSYKYLIKWLQLYARDNIEVYCVERAENYGFNQSVIVEKGRQSYLTLDTNRNFENDIYVLSKDKACTDYYYNMLIMWSIPNCKNCLYYQAPSYIGGCSRYLKQLWESPRKSIFKNIYLFYEKM